MTQPRSEQLVSKPRLASNISRLGRKIAQQRRTFILIRELMQHLLMFTRLCKCIRSQKFISISIYKRVTLLSQSQMPGGDCGKLRPTSEYPVSQPKFEGRTSSSRIEINSVVTTPLFSLYQNRVATNKNNISIPWMYFANSL
jgi:hypothetical protein